MALYGMNLLGVLIAAVLAFVLGGIWYSQNVFGPKWLKYSGISKRKYKESKEKGVAGKHFAGFIASLLMACVLSIFLAYAGAVSIPAALLVAFLLWLGFVATTLIGPILWEGKPFGLFVLNGAYSLLALFVMAIALQLLG